MAAILLMILAAFLAVPVHAADISAIHYESGVETETIAYEPVKVTEPPAYVTGAKTVGGTDILDQTVPPLHFERYALVSRPGAGIDISFVLTSPGIQFQSDLDELRIKIDNTPVTGNTLSADGGVVRVKGNFPYTSLQDQAVRIIELAGMSPADNNKFLVYTTTGDRAAAKNAIYLLNDKISKGGTESLKPDLQKAIDDYKNGKFTQATVIAEAALQKETIRSEGLATGLLPGIIAAIALLIIGLFAGNWYGRKNANKPDLLKIEQVILKYYGMRGEKPFSPVKISKECEIVLDRAFSFNEKRAEQLRAQKAEQGRAVDPDRLTTPDLRPSLFQALHEKATYGKSHAFDAGIVYITNCLNENQSKR